MTLADGIDNGSRSGNLSASTTKMIIHFRSLRKIANPGIAVYPQVSICMDCGFSRFTTRVGVLDSCRGYMNFESVTRQPIAHELPTHKNRVHSRRQVPSGPCLRNVSQRSHAESFLHHVGGGLLGQEDYFGLRGTSANLSSRIDPVQGRESDVEQN